jgi:hypothetical protein
LQRLTKARPHFRYQENEPKRTQTGQTKRLFLRNGPKSSWYSKITNPFCAKVYEGKAAFSLSRKRTQTNPTSTRARLNPGAPGLPMAAPSSASIFRHPSSVVSPLPSVICLLSKQTQSNPIQTQFNPIQTQANPISNPQFSRLPLTVV